MHCNYKFIFHLAVQDKTHTNILIGPTPRTHIHGTGLCLSKILLRLYTITVIVLYEKGIHTLILRVNNILLHTPSNIILCCTSCYFYTRINLLLQA